MLRLEFFELNSINYFRTDFCFQVSLKELIQSRPGYSSYVNLEFSNAKKYVEILNKILKSTMTMSI